jgi:hypothetical protein
MICKLCEHPLLSRPSCGALTNCHCCKEFSETKCCLQKDFVKHGGVMPQPETYAEAQNNKAQTYIR